MRRSSRVNPDMWEEFLEADEIVCCDHGVSFLAYCTECERDAKESI